MPRHLVRLFSSLRRLWYRFWHPRERVGQAALVEHLRGGHAKVSEVEADEHAKQPRSSALADLQRAVSAIQGGRRTMRSSQPAFAVDRLDGYCPADGLEHPAARTDGYTNEVTGIGDWTRDKTFGGSPNGPRFDVRFLSGVECEQRWRGSDLGARIVETKPAEMTRQGWEITIQPSEEDDAPEGKADEFPAPQPAAPKHEPGAIPERQDDSQAIIEALDVQLREMDARDVFRTALSYEIAYGGAAVLVGFDDGETDLTRPLDESKIRGVRHITAFRGGWDGEVIAWRYYRDPTAARYGEPEVYQLRNLGVPISTPPAPGETHYAPIPVGGATGPMIWYVHESRLLIFPGTAVSHRARVQMRGWGDPVFTRCDEVLSDFDQSWGSVAVILQEFSLATLAIKGLTELLSQGSDAARAEIVSRAVTLQMTQSIARMRLIDSDEKIERITASLSGVPETLQQMSYRLSAAADIPVSLLMGQEPAGLNATGDSTVRFWYDRIAAAQGADLQPNLRRLVRWMLLAKEGPAKGTEPARWDVTMRPLWQPTETERATLRKTTAETDQIYIVQGVLTPEEVAASRFGGSKWSGETMLDIEGREAMAALPAPEPVEEPVAEEPTPPALVSVPLSAVGDDHTQQPRSAVGAFHPTETAQTTLAAHIVIFLAGKQVKATAIGSRVSVGLGSIEVGVSGQRTYSQVSAEVRAAVEAFLAEHPEPHVAAWAGKAGAVEVAEINRPFDLPARADREFTEENIQRAENGQFGSGGGGATPAVEEKKLGERAQAREQAKADKAYRAAQDKADKAQAKAQAAQEKAQAKSDKAATKAAEKAVREGARAERQASKAKIAADKAEKVEAVVRAANAPRKENGRIDPKRVPGAGKGYEVVTCDDDRRSYKGRSFMAKSPKDMAHEFLSAGATGGHRSNDAVVEAGLGKGRAKEGGGTWDALRERYKGTVKGAEKVNSIDGAIRVLALASAARATRLGPQKMLPNGQPAPRERVGMRGKPDFRNFDIATLRECDGEEFRHLQMPSWLHDAENARKVRDEMASYYGIHESSPASHSRTERKPRPPKPSKRASGLEDIPF